MEIKKADKKDLTYLTDLFSNCIKDMHSKGLYQWNESYPNKDVLSEDISEGCLYLVTQDEDYLGSITLNEDEPDEYRELAWSKNDLRNLVVHRLAVHPRYQSQGIASELMSFAERIAAEKGYSSIRLDTYSLNKTAIRFYKKLGYGEVGQVYFQGRIEPFICFEKVLST